MSQSRQVMSLSGADTSGAGVGAGATGGAHGNAAIMADRAPKLQSAAQYSQWRAQVEVFLSQRGIGDALSKQRTDTEWNQLVAVAMQQLDEDERVALEALGLKTAATTSSTSSASTDKQREARRVVSSIVHRSQRAYGYLYQALPDELRPQVAQLPQGFAYGLWRWIEEKYRSKEVDNVSVLFREWSELEQGDDESFDAYRARVNNVANLLGNADERPSARMYAYTLLERLRPHYKPVVLALQNSSLMKKTKTIAVPKVEKTELDIDWIEVTRQVNAHERSEQRQCENEDRQSSGGAMSAVRAYSATQQRTGRDKNASTIRNGAWQQPGEQCRDLPAWKVRVNRDASIATSMDTLVRTARDHGERGTRDGPNRKRTLVPNKKKEP